MDINLFGEPIEYKETSQLLYLKEKDELTLGNRIKRLEYLHKLNPDGLIFYGDMELVFCYRKCKKHLLVAISYRPSY